MELSSTPDNRFWFFSAPFASDYARGQQTITTHWPDLVAFARGVETLWLLVRDERRQIVDRVALDRQLILDGERQIATTLEELRGMTAVFRTRCERREDDGTDEILVT